MTTVEWYTVVGMLEDGSDYEGFEYETADRQNAMQIAENILKVGVKSVDMNGQMKPLAGWRVYQGPTCIASGWRVTDGW
jgi:hypothetical protein